MHHYIIVHKYLRNFSSGSTHRFKISSAGCVGCNFLILMNVDVNDASRVNDLIMYLSMIMISQHAVLDNLCQYKTFGCESLNRFRPIYQMETMYDITAIIILHNNMHISILPNWSKSHFSIG